MPNSARDIVEYIIAGVVCILLLVVIGFETIRRSMTQGISDVSQTRKTRRSPTKKQPIQDNDESDALSRRSREHNPKDWEKYSGNITTIYFIVGIPIIYLTYAQFWNDSGQEIVSNLIHISATAPLFGLPESYFFVAFALLAAEVSRGAIMKISETHGEISLRIQGRVSGAVAAFLSLLPVFGELEVVSVLIYTTIFAAAIGYQGYSSEGIKSYLLLIFSFVLIILILIGSIVNLA
ncbi:hypothetical protein [Halorubrum sp. F4]|uniref:hypothetical protein n=1 Tax=Halorubrum sp. F4 TaxID=2989715 RepID=UPI00248191E9|nr:hypothetical protein [Halorubrum sp. F4]